GGVERVLEDVGGAAAEDGVRARDDGGEQGAGDGGRPLPPVRLPPADGRAARQRDPARGGGGVDRDPGGGGRGACAGGDGQLPRCARHARAARHVQRSGDRARGRAGGARCDGRAAVGRGVRRGGRGRRAGVAAGGRAVRGGRARRGVVRGGLGVAGA